MVAQPGVETFGCCLPRKPGKFSTLINKIVDMGTTFSTSILGFLVAGFTVFVTVTKIDIFVTMAKEEYGSSGESYLKYNLVQFVLVFCHYISYLFVCVLFGIFAQKDGLFSLFASGLIGIREFEVTGVFLYKLALSVFLIFIGVWSVYLVLLLKSFIFNTYQVVTTAVRWELEKSENEESQK